MMFKSKTHPQFDFAIDYLTYFRMAESSYEFSLFSSIGWHRINDEAFDKFVCEKKGYKYEPNENGVMDFRDKTTFPYPSFGEMKPKSMDGYIKKYNFEYAGMSDDEVHIYRDDEGEYVSGFAKD